MGTRLPNRNTILTRLSSEKLISERSKEIMVPSLKVEADYKIVGKDGERTGIIECKCFVKQFGQLLHMMFGGLNGYGITDTAGTPKTPSGYSIDYHTLRCTAGAGNANYGIVVGRDNSPVDITDYALVSKCAHGTGANEFGYGGPVSFNLASDEESNTLIATRTFANNSGGSIVVKELGLIVYNDTGYFLILRDVIVGEGFTVLNTEELTINYKIKAIA